MPPDNIFDRQIFGDLSQFDTTCAFVRVIIEPTVSISDIVAGSAVTRLLIAFISRIKDTLTMTTRIKQTLSTTTRIKQTSDSITRVKQDLSSTTRIKDVEDVSV